MVYNSSESPMQTLSSPIKLIKDSVKIFFVKKNLIYFISIYLILVPFQIFQYFQGAFADISVKNIEYDPYVWVTLIVTILYFLIYFLSSAATILAVKKVIASEPLNFKETITFAWKNLWQYLTLSILVFLAVFGGLILLIIPGLVFSVWFFSAKFVFFDKGLGIKASMAESHRLVKGRFWAVWWRLFVFGLFTALAGFTISVIPYGIGGVITTLFGALFVLPAYLLYKELLSNS